MIIVALGAVSLVVFAVPLVHALWDDSPGTFGDRFRRELKRWLETR